MYKHEVNINISVTICKLLVPWKLLGAVQRAGYECSGLEKGKKLELQYFENAYMESF